MPASNATFLATIDGIGVVYKPVRGERPLWDFPDGTLAQREVAAYAVSQALGWNVVPTTVLREGPHGPGMVQAWAEPDVEQLPVDIVARDVRSEEHTSELQSLMRISYAVFCLKNKKKQQ